MNTPNMRDHDNKTHTIRRCLLLGVLLLTSPACDSTLPSTRLRNGVHLPVPTESRPLPGPDRLSHVDIGEEFKLTPLSLIQVAFDRQPNIRSRYHRFKSEEGRYDFFVVSRDSLTPRFRTSNSAGEVRTNADPQVVRRTRDHVLELSIEKQFFDTTELSAAVGLRTNAVDEALGTRPFISADIRYPLWVSRQKLERTSEEIFRRNELNDALLGYIQTVRRRLQNALFRFYEVIDLQRRVMNLAAWQADVDAMIATLDQVRGRDVSNDRLRIAAESAKIGARLRETDGRFSIQRERLKSVCGLPFHATVELIDEPFNPFEGASHAELLKLSIETDPEISTLRNEAQNAKVQLDLARRGRWDVALLLGGDSDLEGGGERDGDSNWSAFFGIDVSAIDPRVTQSLTNQAQARIDRFAQSIIARENAIFVDTYEPIIRIRTLSTSRDELIDNLPRYESDYASGIDEYLAGTLNIDDQLKRRENLFDQQQEISRLIFLVGANTAELCSATGRFFDLIEQSSGG